MRSNLPLISVVNVVLDARLLVVEGLHAKRSVPRAQLTVGEDATRVGARAGLTGSRECTPWFGTGCTTHGKGPPIESETHHNFVRMNAIPP